MSISHWVMTDCLETCLRTNPVLFRNESMTFSLMDSPILVPALNYAAIYGGMNGYFYALAAISVAVGYSEPEQWPDFYGKWCDAYTLRRFWGYSKPHIFLSQSN